ncbi:dynamin family protein [Vibrio fluvialis]|uniref:Dynamin family protein n=1 Tax=Photobacterium damselae subsp. damselae TaxID=85581 RepID=A0A850R3A2_PHODD|nr:dynamin family protein [Vibrio fluvialis]NVP03008.1 dynamin family protein [Photobacterium damselae subsp. damselae]
MITDYKSRKNEVLSSYEQVEILIKEIKDNALRAEMPNPLERLEPLLIDIRNKAEKVRADRFSLMIAGESKSGKSTFINAYLGVELLPMDVKQCTSAIIEIKNGEEFCVQATYADGRRKDISGDSAAREFLKKNAALDDEYRDIPVPTINSEILVKSGLKAKRKGLNISVPKGEVEDLLNAPEVQEANIHNIPMETYKKKIRDYIQEKMNNWQDIVTKIEVIFPFGEEMQGIEIIDSPGVCARGGVAEITSQYIENADAIIFLKPVSGQALESTQFNQFMRNTSVTRNKNALFLVLTRSTSVTDEDLRRLEAEAYQQFSNLDKRNILFVDSKAELYAKKLSVIDDVETELRSLNKAGTLDAFVTQAYTETNGIFGEGDFIKALQEKSRFDYVYNSLEAFGRKAHYILLGSLLDSICDLYIKLYSDLIFQMKMFHQKAENPTELAKKIANVKQELDVINNKVYRGVDTVVRRFLGDDGIIRVEANKAVKDFENRVSLIDARSANAFDELERQSVKKIDFFKELSSALQRNVVSEFDKELISLSDNSDLPVELLQPNFTEQTFDEIRKSTESKAKERESYEDGITFTETKWRSVYSRNKHFELIKTNILSRIETIKNDLIEHLVAFTENIRTRYIEELSKNADAKKKELDAIIEAKATAEQIKELINDLTTLTEQISSAKSEAKKIKGGIVKNVQ